MYDGVKALIHKERELALKVNAICGPQMRKPEDIVHFPLFPPKTNSLLMKSLTPEIWEKYKNLKDKFGGSFKQCLISGCQNVDSGVGVYAVSADSYVTFNEFFDKIIHTYHGVNKHVHEPVMDSSKLTAPSFGPDADDMIISTRIRVGRNLAEYPLGPGISDDQRNEIVAKMVEAFKTFEGDLAGKFYALNNLSHEEKTQLINDHFLFKEGDRFLEAVGLNRDWPNGRGIFHNDDKTFLIWVNEEDQLRIISMQ